MVPRGQFRGLRHLVANFVERQYPADCRHRMIQKLTDTIQLLNANYDLMLPPIFLALYIPCDHIVSYVACHTSLFSSLRRFEHGYVY
jgi:hypothetical protein